MKKKKVKKSPLDRIFRDNDLNFYCPCSDCVSAVMRRLAARIESKTEALNEQRKRTRA